MKELADYLYHVEYAESMVEMGEKADRAMGNGAKEVKTKWDEQAKVYVIEYAIQKVES